MRRFVEGMDRGQSTLFPDRLDDWIGVNNAVGVIDVFVEELDLAELGFGGVDPHADRRFWIFACRWFSGWRRSLLTCGGFWPIMLHTLTNGARIAR